jgi:hypothetical protein
MDARRVWIKSLLCCLAILVLAVNRRGTAHLVNRAHAGTAKRSPSRLVVCF